MAKKRKINKVAYSQRLKSYIKCVGYKGTTDWTFLKCDNNGNVTDNTVYRGTTYYSMFDWKDCDV